ncbi:MAG: porin family protein [Bradyrhizobium sp.]|nr:MAG: porin family protein [Bradyrhizobium sp.]
MLSALSRSMLASFAALTLSAVAASAADLPTHKSAPPPAPMAPAAFSWTGFYLGVEGGGAWGQSRADYPLAGPAGFLPYDPRGAFGGLYAGYNYQMPNNFVLGVEGDVNWGDIRNRTYYHTVPQNPLGFEDTGVGDMSWFGSARVRAGVAIDRFLPFVTGGVAVAEYQNSLFALTNPLFTGTYNHAEVGWTLGAGLEYAITNNISLRAEYRYANYGDQKDTLATNPAAVHDTTLSTNDARVGIAYKF